MGVCGADFAEAGWAMAMQGQEGVDGGQGPYPERPGEPDCVYYMRTGLCGFGMTCRYNHPPNRKLVRFLVHVECGVYGCVGVWWSLQLALALRGLRCEGGGRGQGEAQKRNSVGVVGGWSLAGAWSVGS